MSEDAWTGRIGAPPAPDSELLAALLSHHIYLYMVRLLVCPYRFAVTVRNIHTLLLHMQGHNAGEKYVSPIGTMAVAFVRNAFRFTA